MRIIKEWNKQNWKFTMFFHNNRYTMKVENDSTEQVYKLSDLSDNPSSVLSEATLTPHIAQKIQDIFQSQQSLKSELQSSIQTSTDVEDEFDEIL